MTDQKHQHDHDDPANDIGCLQAIEQLYAYLDGELNPVEKADFELHMQHCRSCYSRKELELKLSQQLQQTADGEPPESLQQRLQELINKI
jgi:anti-sigma factor (TIGR02949 family)